MNIRNMTFEDIDFAVACARAENWASETKEIFEGFLKYDSRGCFIAEENHERVGLCVGTCYGDSGFLGELVVIKEKRGRGIGTKLLNRTLDYLKRCGAKSVLLEADLGAVSLYERVGFRKICWSMRFIGTVKSRLHSDVRKMELDDFDKIREIDRIAFGANRSFFLKRIFSLYPEYCKVQILDGKVVAFIFGRIGFNVVSVGPWIVYQNVKHVNALLESISIETGNTNLRIGVLENHSKALSIVRSYPLMRNQEYCWRMALGSSGLLGQSNFHFAIGSGAKG